jgi:hypothetical protein
MGKKFKELRRLWVEDDDASYISHSGVVAISQGCAKLRYLALYVWYHQCCTCYGVTGLFTPHRLPYCAWRKGQEFCRFALGWFITKGLREPNMILPLPATRSTNRPGIGSYWRVWAQSQVVTLRYHRGKWCGSCQSCIWMPTIGTPGSVTLSIWGSKLCYYSGGNKFPEISVGAKPPLNQWNRGTTSGPVLPMFAHWSVPWCPGTTWAALGILCTNRTAH